MKICPVELRTRAPGAGGFDRYLISEVSGNKKTTATSLPLGRDGPSGVTPQIMSLDRVIRNRFTLRWRHCALAEEARRASRAATPPMFFVPPDLLRSRRTQIKKDASLIDARWGTVFDRKVR
jgi:hypothetical protein